MLANKLSLCDVDSATSFDTPACPPLRRLQQFEPVREHYRFYFEFDLLDVEEVRIDLFCWNKDVRAFLRIISDH